MRANRGRKLNGRVSLGSSQEAVEYAGEVLKFADDTATGVNVPSRGKFAAGHIERLESSVLYHIGVSRRRHHFRVAVEPNDRAAVGSGAVVHGGRHISGGECTAWCPSEPEHRAHQ